ncbi:hypothetical protein [Streptomyces europaeiscabiei]
MRPQLWCNRPYSRSPCLLLPFPFLPVSRSSLLLPLLPLLLLLLPVT